MACTFSHIAVSHFCDQQSSKSLVFPTVDLVTYNAVDLRSVADRFFGPGGPAHTKMMQLMRVRATVPHGSKYIDLIVKESWSGDKSCDCTQGQNCGGSPGIRARGLGDEPSC